MLLRALEVAVQCFPEITGNSCQSLADAACDIHHNFVAEEEHFCQKLFVHRKGAIRLAADQVGLVPGSMGTNSTLSKAAAISGKLRCDVAAAITRKRVPKLLFQVL